VNADDLRRFARRDWVAVANRKSDYWIDQYRRHGAASAWTASTALWLHMRSVQPDYPSAANRQEDRAAHRSLRRRLDRAAHAFTSR
jgi:hypothetical protein